MLSNIKDTILEIIRYCDEAKSREEIFEYIKLYNNSKNYNKHIKPIIELGWLQQTIPDKPTSKNQKYITSEIAKRLIEQKTKGINRIPVESSNIASVGYDTENKILEIEFHHGGIYQYFDVPKEVYENLINATAIGSYFFHNIRNNHDYSKK